MRRGRRRRRRLGVGEEERRRVRRRDEGEGEEELGVADAGRSAAGAVDDFLILVAVCLLETWNCEGE